MSISLSFTDPCLSDPCRGEKSLCQALSANEFRCICDEEHIPINGSAIGFGCKHIGTCGPYSDLQVDGSCRCFQDFFEEEHGDAESPKGCQSKKEYFSESSYIA